MIAILSLESSLVQKGILSTDSKTQEWLLKCTKKVLLFLAYLFIILITYNIECNTSIFY